MADLHLPREEETLDDVLGGALRIFQKKKGYRFSLDALLLAHFVKVKSGANVLDLGAGAGVIAFILAKHGMCGRITGLEIQEEMAEMARRSAHLNELEDRVEFLTGDVKKIATLVKPQSFPAVLFNPPYRKLHSGRINPDDRKAVARHEVRGALGDFLTAARHALQAGGRVFLIYPAARMVELVCRMRAEGLEPKRVRLVHSHATSEGEFVLAEGLKGGGEELDVMPPLFIYGPDGEYTAAMADIFRELSSLP